MNKLILLLVLLFVAFQLNAATINNAGSGNWSASAWPSTNRTGTISVSNGSAAVTGIGTLFTTEISVGNIIKLTGGGTTIGTVLSITDNTNLTLTTNVSTARSGITYSSQGVGSGDAVIIGGSIAGIISTVTVDNAYAKCSSLIVNQSGSFGTSGVLQFNVGSILTVSGNVLEGGSLFSPWGDIDMTDGGTFVIGGAWTYGGGTFTPGTGTVVYNGAAQTILATTYNNLTPSGSLAKTLGGNTTVTGTLSLQGTASLALAGHTLTYGGSSTLEYAGSSVQTTTNAEFPASGGPHSLTLNNINGVILHAPRTITGVFTLIYGSITTSATNLLTFTSTATVGVGAGIDQSSFVEGPMAYVFTSAGLKSNLNYPIGKEGIWRPLRLTLNQTTATSSSYIAECVSVAPPVNSLPVGLDGVSLVRYYTISENVGGSAFTDGFLQIIWGWDDYASDSSYIKIAQGPAAGGGTWVNLGGIPAGDQYVGNVTSKYGFTSPLINTAFTLADSTGGSNPLPVELSSFTSIVNGRNVNLNWETKTEKNSNKFVIERTKTDGNVANLKWESVTSVKTAFNSNVPKQYSYIDKNVQAGKYQYRLKMMDNDGSFEYSKVIETEIALPKDFGLSQNYPNPFNPTTKINYTLPNDSRVTLEVFNLVGERVAQIVNAQQSAGYYVVNFGASSVKNIASGIYIYKLTAADNTGKNFSSIKKMMLLK